MNENRDKDLRFLETARYHDFNHLKIFVLHGNNGSLK